MEVRRPSTTALVYSAIRALSISLALYSSKVDGVKVARAQTTSAADAMLMIDVHLAGSSPIEHQTVVSALALAAALWQIRRCSACRWNAARSCPHTRTAAHANILNRAAESGRLVPLEMGPG